MPGISVVAVREHQKRQHHIEKLNRRCLRDASDPLSHPYASFSRLYRLNKESFVMVLENIKPYVKTSTIPLTLRLAITLRFLATGSYQGVICKDVDLCVARSTVSVILWIIINALEDHICPQWIKLEMTPEKKRSSHRYFFDKYQIPGIVGCIDGTHIKISKPSQDESLFYNRKGTFSINAMIICDFQMKVLAVDARKPGSCHDAFVWSLSDARSYLLNKFMSGDPSCRLLGDSGYGLEPFLITPYKDVVAGTSEHKFNKKHCSARNIVERTIGVIKSRFRCLLNKMPYTPEKAIKVTNVCCALHNICREFNVEFEETPILDPQDDHPELNDVEVFNTDRNLYNCGKSLRDSIASQMV